MGKKLKHQESVKISKMSCSNSNKKINLNTLIKVLKPKVYITDSSAFKTLVQELTGNGSNISMITTTPMISDPLSLEYSEPSPPHDHHHLSDIIISSSQLPIYNYGSDEQSSPQLSFDSSEATLSINSTLPATQHDQHNMMTTTPALISTSSTSDDHDDDLQSCSWFDKYDHDNTSTNYPQYNDNGVIDQSLYDAASFLLDNMADDPFLYNYDDHTTAFPNIPVVLPEVCVYDYDLSWIM